uniref:Uncharacterized protein n=1 Tax=Zea mays TaxID=4577 RepID=C0PIE0_MAIZE|nr:unknown [Zea mays]
MMEYNSVIPLTVRMTVQYAWKNMIMRIRRLHCNANIISTLAAFTSGWKGARLARSVQRLCCSMRMNDPADGSLPRQQVEDPS